MNKLYLSIICIVLFFQTNCMQSSGDDFLDLFDRTSALSEPASPNVLSERMQLLDQQRDNIKNLKELLQQSHHQTVEKIALFNALLLENTTQQLSNSPVQDATNSIFYPHESSKCMHEVATKTITIIKKQPNLTENEKRNLGLLSLRIFDFLKVVHAKKGYLPVHLQSDLATFAEFTNVLLSKIK